ncbi:hypothetical protein [Caldisphaera sp.]|uniref:hypothetical protein n=1 Tax=Caldisphaera sp. TaxID=2060322 RepID=UPI0025C32FF9|nr:hypothetical protein [Caldisphaera sp.]
MQAEKGGKLVNLSKSDLKALENFVSQLGINISSIATNLKKLEIENGKYNDIFDIPIQLEIIVNSLESIYTTGFYLGYIKNNKFYPGLTLLRRISRLCNEINCIKLNKKGEKQFLYGKIVKNNIISFKEGLRVILNENDEPIGWGIGKVINRKKEIKIVEPVKDLGWYLRRGG